MSETEREILKVLIELDQAVKHVPGASSRPDLLSYFERLDNLANQLPRTADPELLHFLQRKSYAKARAKLEGRAAERGSCGR